MPHIRASCLALDETGQLSQVTHQCRSRPAAPSTSPDTTDHHLEAKSFTETDGRSGRLVGSGLASQVLVQARSGWQAAISKLTNPGTVTHGAGYLLPGP
jgi:hypothetical protein